jgi:osmotically-inducible protein OsmY
MPSTAPISRATQLEIEILKRARTLAAALLGEAHSFTAHALDRAGSIRLRRMDAARATQPTGADSALRAQVLARLEPLPSWHRDLCDVLVVDGTVVLQGLLGPSADRLAARAMAMNTPGVRAVRDDRVRRPFA